MPGRDGQPGQGLRRAGGRRTSARSARGHSEKRPGRIKIGDTTADGYQKSGRPIIGPPRPGDIVFFGRPPTHCGIYVGDGKMINAPHSGAVVRVDEIGGRRGAITYRRFD
ncbi:NlpC/P60 family protein [Spongiactinospora sp. TRM90649]|uniref:C40 family peptidase n=1 Tax=Spongiactinospora sp. TRM90649 TaxID=3031114 RepID=UPI0023F8B943|nr:NlpC/P60 family protein [Spongiactinospora sp. TRM90649]MDF5755590.1 NlpC/P60 family protein [Spongiactinospora sp. TRM90649]